MCISFLSHIRMKYCFVNLCFFSNIYIQAHVKYFALYRSYKIHWQLNPYSSIEVRYLVKTFELTSIFATLMHLECSKYKLYVGAMLQNEAKATLKKCCIQSKSQFNTRVIQQYIFNYLSNKNQSFENWKTPPQRKNSEFYN